MAQPKAGACCGARVVNLLGMTADALRWPPTVAALTRCDADRYLTFRSAATAAASTGAIRVWPQDDGVAERLIPRRIAVVDATLCHIHAKTCCIHAALLSRECNSFSRSCENFWHSSEDFSHWSEIFSHSCE